jgi:hypothetical protein
MLIEAFKSPIQSSDTLPTLVVGGLLALVGVGLLAAAASVPVALVGSEVPATTAAGIGLGLGFVSVPFILIVLGYLLRVAHAGAREEPVPSFVEWSGLLKGGLGAGVVVLAYLLPAVVFAAAAAAAWAGFWGDEGVLPMSASGRQAALVAGGLLVSGYGVVYAYVTPAALATYGVGGRLRSALWPGTTVRAAASIDYLKSWFVAGFAFLLGLALVATVIGAPIAFYFLSVVGALLGRGVRGALGVAPTTADAAVGDGTDGESGDGDSGHGTLADPATVDDMDAETTTGDSVTEGEPGSGSRAGTGAGGAAGPADPFEDDSTGGSLSSPFDDGEATGATSGTAGGSGGTAEASTDQESQADDAPEDLDGYQVAEETEVDRHPDPNAAFAELDLSNGERSPADATEGTTSGSAGPDDRSVAGATSGGAAASGETKTDAETDTESETETAAEPDAEAGSASGIGTGPTGEPGPGGAADRSGREEDGVSAATDPRAEPGSETDTATGEGDHGAVGEPGRGGHGGDQATGAAGTEETHTDSTAADDVTAPEPADGDGGEDGDRTGDEDAEDDDGDGFEWGQIDE